MTLKVYKPTPKNVAKLMKIGIFDFTQKFHFWQNCAKKFQLFYGINIYSYGSIKGGMKLWSMYVTGILRPDLCSLP